MTRLSRLVRHALVSVLMRLELLPARAARAGSLQSERGIEQTPRVRAALRVALLACISGLAGRGAWAQGSGAMAPNCGGIPPLELVEATLDQLQFALRTGQITSEELVRRYLARIEAYDDGFPFLNGVQAVNPAVLEEARARDAERRLGRAHGPLFGIPVLVKDNIDALGMPTTCCSLALENSFPPDDAHVVQRLRAAGAILLGKATLTEFAHLLTVDMPLGYSSLGGYGFNPYDPRPRPGGNGQPVLSPGGSSSGCGIAVAASLAPVAIGTESTGSILSPSSLNGLVGIKPTIGLISRDGIAPVSLTQGTAGPMARTVRDAAILLGALVGYDSADPATGICRERGRVPAEYTRFLDKHALEGARIAVIRFYWGNLSVAQSARMRQCLAILRSLGATVLDRNLPRQIELAMLGISLTYPPPPRTSSVLLYDFKNEQDAYLAGLGPSAPMHSLAEVIAFNAAHPLEALRFGQTIALAADQMDTSPLSRDTLRYEMDRARDIALFRGAVDAVFTGPDDLPDTEDDFDALLFPAAAGADLMARASYPSITVPAEFLAPSGLVENDYPFGLTFSGPALSEPRLLGFAYAFEQATHFRRAPESAPPLSPQAR